MNYYGARQREKDGRWDYTCKNDDRIWPVGYCHEYRPWTPDKVFWLPEDSRAEQAARYEAEQAPFQAKYHGDGHATREEAERCYWEYELDNAKATAVEGAQYPCAVCRAWTQRGYSTGQGHMTTTLLCDAHRNRAGLEQARPFRPGTTVMSSC